ncbi:MAG: YkgJ family cysteine cluster protein [Chitinophagaceae bacterium]
MDKTLLDWRKKAKDHRKENQQFLQKMQTKKGKEMLKFLPKLHEEAFSCISCLECAACCKTISPRFKTPDIRRISKHLGMKEVELVDRFLKIDQEGDNFCGIYEVRPGDCKNYPYTDSEILFKRPTTTLMNSEICPAVHEVLEKLKHIQQGS